MNSTIVTMNKINCKKNIKNQKGIVFILTALISISVILLLILAIDMARLHESKQTLHTQAQLLAEAGVKLRIQEGIRDVVVDGQIVCCFTGKTSDGNEKTSCIEKCPCDEDPCNGNIGYTCLVDTTVKDKKLIFGKYFTKELGDDIPLKSRGTSCYNADAANFGLYPFYFAN